MNDDLPSCAAISKTVGIVSWNDFLATRRDYDVSRCRYDIETIETAATNVHELCRLTLNEGDVVLICSDGGSRSTNVVIGTGGDHRPFMDGVIDRTPYLTDVLTGCATVLRRLEKQIADIGDGEKMITEDALRRTEIHADVTDALGDASWNGEVEIVAPTPFVPARAIGFCFTSIGRKMADMRDHLLPLLEPIVCVSFREHVSGEDMTRFDPYCRSARRNVDGMEMLRIHQRIDAMVKGRS